MVAIGRCEVLYLESNKVPDVSEKVHVTLVNCLLLPPTIVLLLIVRSEEVSLVILVRLEV